MEYKARLQEMKAFVLDQVPDSVTDAKLTQRALLKAGNLWPYLGLNAGNLAAFDSEDSEGRDRRPQVAPMAYLVIILFVEQVNGGFGYNPERALAGKVKAIPGSSVKERLIYAIQSELDEIESEEEFDRKYDQAAG